MNNVLWICSALFVVVLLLSNSNHVDGRGSSRSDEMSLVCTAAEQTAHPVLCLLLHAARNNEDAFAREANLWAKNNHLIIDRQSFSMRQIGQLDVNKNQQKRVQRRTQEAFGLSLSQRPVVFAHGMGDSCFNSGMNHIVQKAAEILGVYTTCIPTGDSLSEDTNNGYFLDMDSSVAVFAKKISQDPLLSEGFHAIGFSQGNNIIRGYVQQFNEPAVHTFVSVNGVNAGIGAVPYCRPTDSSSSTWQSLGVSHSLCDLLMEQASRAAYTKFAQSHSFQAGYWRDPRPSAFPLYQQFGQLAVWNNEAGYINETLKENYAKTSRFVWILASNDGMVWPKEGEQWGAPDPNDPFNHILSYNETDWYKQDLFGLRTAEEAGKNVYDSFEGDHLQFSEEDFERWVDTYLR